MKKEKKKSSSWIYIILVMIMIVASVSEESDEMTAVIALLITVGVIGFVVYGIVKSIKKNSGHVDNITGQKKSNMHSHDRLTVSAENLMECNGLDHYKKQLDGFLSAGIIDRSEYYVLLNKYRSQLGK